MFLVQPLSYFKLVNATGIMYILYYEYVLFHSLKNIVIYLQKICTENAKQCSLPNCYAFHGIIYTFSIQTNQLQCYTSIHMYDMYIHIYICKLYKSNESRTFYFILLYLNNIIIVIIVVIETHFELFALRTCAKQHSHLYASKHNEVARCSAELFTRFLRDARLNCSWQNTLLDCIILLQ